MTFRGNPFDCLRQDLSEALDIITYQLRKYELTEAEEDALYAASLSAEGLKLILENLKSRFKERTNGVVGVYVDVDRPRIVRRFPTLATVAGKEAGGAQQAAE